MVRLPLLNYRSVMFTVLLLSCGVTIMWSNNMPIHLELEAYSGVPFQASTSGSQRRQRPWYQPDLSFTVKGDRGDVNRRHAGGSPTNGASDSTSAATTVSNRFCTRDQVVKGQWEPVRLPKPPYVTKTVHLRCYSRERYHGDHYDTWKWQPEDASSTAVDTSPEDSSSESCEFTDWDSSLFCSLLAGATVSIIGDSLSWEHYSSLVQLLGVSTRQGYQHQSREFQTNIQQAVCDGHTAVVYRRDDQLADLRSSLQETFPTVLVLNRGAHYTNDTNLLAGVRHNLQQVGSWLDQCRSLGVPCSFFWRTSTPGHPGCDNASDTQPVNDLTAMEARIADQSLYTERQLRYHWDDFQRQNLLILNELEASGLDFTVLDAYSLNVLRPDEHRAHQSDCLHNCYPGKMDVYSQLLLHYLRQRLDPIAIQKVRQVSRQQRWKTDVTTVYDKAATQAAREKRLEK